MMKKFLAGMAMAAMLSSSAFATYTATDSSSSEAEVTAQAAVDEAVSLNSDMSSDWGALSDAGRRTTLTELASDTVASVANAATGAIQSGNATVGGRMATVREAAWAGQPMGAAGPTAAAAGWDVWANTFLNYADHDSKGGKNGYDADTYGLVFGADKMSGNWMFGASLGYSWTDVDADNVSYDTDVDSWLLGFYASYSTARWYVDGGLSWAKSDIESERKLTALNLTAKGDTDSSSWSYFANAGYNFEVAPKLIVTPFAGLEYVFTDTDGYTESGAGNWNQQVMEYDNDAFFGTLGVKASYAFTDRITGELRASYTHDFVDENPKVKSRFAVAGANYQEYEGLRADDDAWGLGAGISGQINDQTSVFFNYDWETKDEFDSHTFNLGARFEF